MPKGTAEIQLTKAAELDVASIAKYTIYKFGLGQARKYRNGLINTLELLANKPTLGTAFYIGDKIELKRFRFKAHMIFYKEIPSGILVIRILGGMMDFKRHL
nr:type II toxin-antitoxin system RelE/ParE family toxin [Allomuricauda sp.]